ncbi:MAG: DnaB-like helicase C-terminal domain-containing protein [Candidatus Caldatribacteriota bacterium]
MAIGADLLFKIVKEKKLSYFTRLNKEWFYGYDRDVFIAIEKVFNTYNMLPSFEELSDKFGYDKALEMPLNYYINEFTEFVIEKNIENTAEDVNKILKSTTRSRKDAVLALKRLVESTKEVESIITSEIKTIAEIGSDYLLEVYNNRVMEAGITTGWKTLDKYTNGLQKGNIFAVLARVKMGKTAVMLHMANAAMESGYKVMFISMEMTEKEIFDRLFALRNKLSATHLHINQVSDFALNKIKQDNENLKNKNFLFLEGKFNTDIDSILSLILTHTPDIVFIDGAYLIKEQSNKNKQIWERIGDVIERLKRCSMSMNIPIVLSYQLNRTVSRNKSSLKDKAFEAIQLSDAISQIVSTGITITKPEKSYDDVRILELIGGRRGEEGAVVINWKWNPMGLSELPQEIQYSVLREEGIYG